MCGLNKKDLEKIFEKLDKNGDGLLSLEELNMLLEGIGVSLSIKELQSSVGNSSLNFNEFSRFYYDSIQKQEDEDEDEDDRELVDAFKVFDENGDGLISCEELEGVLKRLGLWDETIKNCKNMIGVYDTNFDGFLDFQEFKNMMLQ
ncbi:Calcium-binding EF-hand family protein [Euphorbia peplus]|nr:Calcium-binding EF-hand family protein [Euphorbia peplus]